MTLGEDTYITVDEADDYISASYAAGAPERVAWEALTADEKTDKLVIACVKLDRLPFVGYSPRSQQLVFPRVGQREVPVAIKYALVEIALVAYRSAANQQQAADSRERAKLQADGVTGFSLGDLSEQYGSSASSSLRLYPELADEQVNLLVSRYLQGGFDAC